MEWLLRQQLLFLPQGAVVGLGLGVLLDVIGGYWRGKSYRHLLFVFDLLLCVIASVITLFTALIVADGYLHPAIFVGLILGVIAERFSIGRWVSVLAHRIHTWCRSCLARMKRGGALLVRNARRSGVNKAGFSMETKMMD